LTKKLPPLGSHCSLHAYYMHLTVTASLYHPHVI